MVWVLVRKLLRDLRVAWIIVVVLLFLFQLLWARITYRVTGQITQTLNKMRVPMKLIQGLLLGEGDIPGQNELPGQMVQAVIGGEKIKFDRGIDMMSISYVHPLVITILCLWAIGRAANAIAGEIDRGTMELLLAQPIRRTQVIAAHLLVDAIVFPALGLLLWLGTYFGTLWMGLQFPPEEEMVVDPARFLPALLYVLALLFAVSGMTMWVSSLGRSRPRVWGWAVSLTFGMFLINVLGQIWSDSLEWLRPLTIFYHYQPQNLILHEDWASAGPHLLVLMGAGAIGYCLAWVTFCRRDLPAPL